jgi:hypothetical protein
VAPPEASWITPEMKFLWWAASGVISLAAVAIAWAAKTFVSLAKDAVAKAKQEAVEEAERKAALQLLRGDLQRTQGEVTELRTLLGISEPEMKRAAIRRKLGINERVGEDEEESARARWHGPDALPAPASETQRARRLGGSTAWKGKPPDGDDSGE